MNDMNAFENQLGQVLQGAAGPSRPTDVAAIVSVATTPGPSKFSQLFGATRLAVAAAIIALFGGLLVFGLIVTQDDAALLPGDSPSASPGPTDPLQALLTTEEVVPGIARVLEDGTDHRLSEVSEDPEAAGFSRIAVGASGEVWVYEGSGSMFRLGQPGAHAADPYWEGGVQSLGYTADQQLAAVDGQGRMVSVAADTSDAGADDIPWSSPIDESDRTWSSFDGEQIIRAAPDAAADTFDAGELAGQLNDSVAETNVFDYSDEVWAALLDDEPSEACAMAQTSDGVLWAGVCSAWGGGFGGGGLARFDGEAWEAVDPLAGTELDHIVVSDVFFLAPGANGTLWAAAWTSSLERLQAGYTEGWSAARDLPLEPFMGLVLFQLNEDSWTAHEGSIISGNAETMNLTDPIGVVDDAGRLWFGSGDHTGVDGEGQLSTLPGSAVLASYDGDSTRWHPSVGVVQDIGRHPDGSIWVAGAGGIYIVDPDQAHEDSVEPAPGPRYAVSDRIVERALVEITEPNVAKLLELDGLDAGPDNGLGFDESIDILTNTAADVYISDGSRLYQLDGAEANGLQLPEGAADLKLADDGSIWHTSASGETPFVVGIVGEDPSSLASGADRSGPSLVEVHRDGTVVGAWRDGQGQTVVHLFQAREWSPIAQPIPGEIDSLHISDGEVWVVHGGRLSGADWHDGSWRDYVEPPAEFHQIDVSESGGAVALVVDEDGRQRLISHDGNNDEWNDEGLELPAGFRVLPNEAVASSSPVLERGGPFEVGPYGAVWFALAGDGCAGVASWQEEKLTRYLQDHCIGAIEIVDDGSVLAQSLTDGSIYVIRP